jgi:hypothetical protein
MATYSLKEVLEKPERLLLMQAHEDPNTFFIAFKYDRSIPDEKPILESDEAEIILLTDDGFIIQGSYNLPNKWRVTESDMHGNAIYRIPFDACHAIYDVQEYECVCMAREADYRLLSYAR